MIASIHRDEQQSVCEYFDAQALAQALAQAVWSCQNLQNIYH
jgi:hypothetical protein